MRQRRRLIWLAAALALTGAAVPTQHASAGNEIRLPLPPLPPLPPLLFPKLPDPRDLIPIPNIEAFFVPDIDVDIVFRNGYWWTPKDGQWHRSRDYRGPYVLVPRPQVPAEVMRLPPRFRTQYGKEKRIPYGQWKKMHGRDHRDREENRDRKEYRDRGEDRGERRSDDDRDEEHKRKGGHGKGH